MRLPVAEDDLAELELLKSGWRREFVASEPRLSEMCDLFTSLGKEVLLQSAREELTTQDDSCKTCFASVIEEPFTIWTREMENAV